MPTLRGVEAHLTAIDGKPLAEWGVQTFARSSFCSCYVVAETNMAFRVTLKPIIPYPATDGPAAHRYPTRARGSIMPAPSKVEDEWEDIEGDTEMESTGSAAKNDEQRWNDSFYRKEKDKPPQLKQELSYKPAYGGGRRNALIPSMIPIPDPAPAFDFLASLFIDGRRKPERRIIVYLDPKDNDFHDDGLATFKSRWVEDADGQIKEYNWVFNEVGIETMFDKMLISGEIQTGDKIAARDEDSIIAAMNKTAIDDEEKTAQDKGGIGQIRIELQRVVLGRKWEDLNYHAKHREGDQEDMKMDDMDEVSHTTGLTAPKVVSSKAVCVVNYVPYKRDEGVYATFKFMYRSREKLQRYSFPCFPSTACPAPTHTGRRTRRKLKQMQDKFNQLTPLNIQNKPKKGTKCLKSVESTFEENVKSGKIRKGKAPAIDFGSNYRDPKTATVTRDESPSPEDRLSLDSTPPFLGSSTHSTSSSPPQSSIAGDERIGHAGPANRSLDTKVNGRPLARLSFRRPKLPIDQDLLSSSDPIDDSNSASAAAAAAKSTTPGPVPPPFDIPATEFRKRDTPESDADDEQDSDMETHTGSDVANGDDAESENDENELDQSRTDGDDQGLGAALFGISLGKRGRDSGDGEGEGNGERDKKDEGSEGSRDMSLERDGAVSTPLSGAVADDERAVGLRKGVPGIVVTPASSEEGGNDGEGKGKQLAAGESRSKRQKVQEK